MYKSRAAVQVWDMGHWDSEARGGPAYKLCPGENIHKKPVSLSEQCGETRDSGAVNTTARDIWIAICAPPPPPPLHCHLVISIITLIGETLLAWAGLGWAGLAGLAWAGRSAETEPVVSPCTSSQQPGSARQCQAQLGGPCLQPATSNPGIKKQILDDTLIHTLMHHKHCIKTSLHVLCTYVLRTIQTISARVSMG